MGLRARRAGSAGQSDDAASDSRRATFWVGKGPGDPVDYSERVGQRCRVREASSACPRSAPPRGTRPRRPGSGRLRRRHACAPVRPPSRSARHRRGRPGTRRTGRRPEATTSRRPWRAPRAPAGRSRRGHREAQCHGQQHASRVLPHARPGPRWSSSRHPPASSSAPRPAPPPPPSARWRSRRPRTAAPAVETMGSATVTSIGIRTGCTVPERRGAGGACRVSATGPGRAEMTGPPPRPAPEPADPVVGRATRRNGRRGSTTSSQIRASTPRTYPVTA